MVATFPASRGLSFLPRRERPPAASRVVATNRVWAFTVIVRRRPCLALHARLGLGRSAWEASS